VVIGGMSVWTYLILSDVMLHFLVSALMVSIATLLAYRVGVERRSRLTNSRSLAIQDGATTPLTRASAIIIYIAGWFTLIMGTIVTGSGPHGGDPSAPRHDFDQ